MTIYSKEVVLHFDEVISDAVIKENNKAVRDFLQNVGWISGNKYIRLGKFFLLQFLHHYSTTPQPRQTFLRAPQQRKKAL